MVSSYPKIQYHSVFCSTICFLSVHVFSMGARIDGFLIFAQRFLCLRYSSQYMLQTSVVAHPSYSSSICSGIIGGDF